MKVYVAGSYSVVVAMILKEIAGKQIRVDVDTTRNAYAAWSPWRCDCSYCKNFRQQWDAMIGMEVRSKLLELGINPEKPDEIVEFGPSPLPRRGRLYGLHWAFVGEAESTLGPLPAEPDSPIFSVGSSTCNMADRRFAQDGRTASVGLLIPHVPWVLSEPEPA